ncbi:MAG TPA: hypothetical protein DCP51_05745 [Clostridiales bacterium]|nr:MAG: hypothetical protein A2Y40_00970 [Candidatus Margulisbacteria bacterium GWF2_35_9]HAN21163.1 hypothetical protein [Clostridiales bacterium]
MIKILPINIDAPVTTECWSFYRTSIISAHNNLKFWLLQHYNNLYSDFKKNLYYGEHGHKYDQYNYYNNVLETKCFSHKSIKSDNLIKFIVDNINNNKYVLLECDYNILMEREGLYIHEILIYGYDESRKIFYIPILQNTRWISQEFSYQDVVSSFEALDNLKEDKAISEMYKREYLSSITTFNILDYEMNFCIESFYNHIKSIRNEICRKYITYVDENRVSEYKNGYWTCYNTLLEIAAEIINGNNILLNEYNYSLNIRKLLEYRVRIKNDIDILIDKFNIKADINILNNAEEICDILERCCNISIKFNKTNDNKYMWLISDFLVEAFNKEKVIIDHLYSLTREYMIREYW